MCRKHSFFEAMRGLVVGDLESWFACGLNGFTVMLGDEKISSYSFVSVYFKRYSFTSRLGEASKWSKIKQNIFCLPYKSSRYLQLIINGCDLYNIFFF